MFDAEGLEANSSNRRQLIEEQQVPRGLILARDGRTQLARSIPRGRGERRTYTRTYPEGSLFSQPIGYSFISNGRRSLEQSRNDALAGEEDEFESILSGLESREREGEDVVTNLDVGAQQAAYAALGGRKGAVVAIEPQTGKVRVMASDPSYDPNRIPSDFRPINGDPDQPLLNRTTQELYPPGSTFKVVTATAALDTGKVSPSRSSTAPRRRPSAACRWRTSAARTSGRSRSRTRSRTPSTPSSRRSARTSVARRWSSTWTATASARTPSSTIRTTR